MYCMHCGQEIPDQSKFCYKCGQQIEVRAHEAAKVDAKAAATMRPVSSAPAADYATPVVTGTQPDQASPEDLFSADDKLYDEMVDESFENVETVETSAPPMSRGRMGLILAGIAQVGLVLIWLSTYVLDGMGVPVTVGAENAYTILLIAMFALALVSFMFCGGRRVWSWLTKGFSLSLGMAIIPVFLPVFVVVTVFWAAFAMMLVFLVPILPVYLTYREYYG